MRLGNLEKVFEQEQTINEAVKDNVFTNNINNLKKPTKWSKILTSLSHYGMNYDDKIYKNMVAVPADKLVQDKDSLMIEQTLFGDQMGNWKIKAEEDKAFVEKTLSEKREILRKMAMQPELEDILDIMANEAIVYDDNESYICTPFIDDALVQDLNEKAAEEIKSAMNTLFYKIYLLTDWKKSVWSIFKRFLVEGVLAYEIEYDDLKNPKTIIAIIDLDPATLTKTVKDGVIYWVQFKGVIGRERTLLDAQVIYIKYEDSGVSTRQSYLERLIRPFNIYRIIEQAQIIWTVTQSSFKTMFTIPIGGLSRARGIQTLASAMNRYKEDISFNIETGELEVNGKVNMPFNKEYWFPQNENGKPELETLVDNGPTLNDSDQIKYFESKLYKMSKIPESRFDKDAQTTWFGSDPTQALRDEINFSRFVNRLRDAFGEIVLKPLRISLSLQIPDIKNDKRILDSVSLRFNSYNLFEEMINIDIMTKRIEFIGTFKDSITVPDAEGNDIPYFTPKFLVTKYLKMSDADLELNEKYKLEDKLKTKNAKKIKEKGENKDKKEKLMDTDLPKKEKDEPEELDKEMMGNVQPESEETISV